jgi:hypothetical protein
MRRFVPESVESLPPAADRRRLLQPARRRYPVKSIVEQKVDDDDNARKTKIESLRSATKQYDYSDDASCDGDKITATNNATLGQEPLKQGL